MMRRNGETSHKPDLHRRYLYLCIFFAVCCCIFTIRLIGYQLISRDSYATSAEVSGSVRTVKVRAQRGNICDRHGTVIVTNKYTYDIMIEYGALPEDREEAYASYLGALDFIDELDIERAKTYFPLVGQYPTYTYSNEIKDPDSVQRRKLLSVLKLYFVGDGKDYATAEEALHGVSASELGCYIAEKFGIVKKNKDGTIQYNYTELDTEKLIALRYEMAADGFGVISPYILAEDVGELAASAVKERHLTGITVAENAVREYNFRKADGTRYASHLLGTVGPITAENSDYYTSLGYPISAQVGRSGCELAFEEYLRGIDGELAIVEDENGRIINTYFVKEPVPGKDVYLTIDINVQITAEDALDAEIKKNNGVGGAVAATDPNTGEILALVSAPNGEINRAISAYEPGSTFKVGVALAALNEGMIESYTNLMTYGSYNGMKCSHYVSEGVCCGNINVVGALESSCNYFFAYLGDELGTEKIKKYAELFGFGQSTGIEIGLNASLPEANGNISDKENLDYMAAIGQLSTATPLQVSQYIAMIANGGTRYSAHLLYCVVEFDTHNVVFEQEKKVLASFSQAGISSEDTNAVCRGMYAVVYGEHASSYVADAFRSAPYKVAGKTGTAQVSGQKDNALFVGYAPYSNPKIVVTCFVEQGNTGGLASGVVRDVMDAFSRYVSPLADGSWKDDAAG